MLQRDWRLINFDSIEALPAALVRGRANAVARALAQADWLLRRKADGRYLAVFAVRDGGLRWQSLAPDNAWPAEVRRGAVSTWREHIIDAICRHASVDEGVRLSTERVRQHLARLAIPDDDGALHRFELVAEPRVLAYAGRDRYARPLFLATRAARAWKRMRAGALREGIVLEAISGYRSHAYQVGIFERKLARGQRIEDILAVNAAPGFSEHHGGNALDIGTPGEPPAEESFEATPAFDWLTRNAGEFDFVLSYPRGNVHGIVYEPWHWCWHEKPIDTDTR